MNPRILIVSVALCCTAIVGCGEYRSEFSFNEKTDELIPPAREVVVKQLNENFGTPEELVAWLKFPIDYGDPESLTVAVQEFNPSSVGRLQVNLPERDTGTYDGAELQLADGVKHRISSYDAQKKHLHVTPGIKAGLKRGDEVTIVTRPHGWKLVQGRNLYMKHCLHCHGVSGDGNGPTAEYLNPRPRDYRLGVLKFTSTTSTEKATKADVEQILFNGVPGTSMPSFKLKLIGDDMSAIVAYVRFLATRGEYELRLGGELRALGGSEADVKSRLKNDGISRDDILKEFQEELDSELSDLLDTVPSDLAENLTRAEDPESIVLPKKAKHTSTPESIARGRALYISKEAKCSDCHGVAGYGDGRQTEDFMQIPQSTLTYEKPGLYDTWGNPIKPRNLRKGMYRGGRRPIDIYRRISAGIKGTPMPGFSTSLNDDQIWDLVNYVMSLPYQQQSPAPIKARESVADNSAR